VPGTQLLSIEYNVIKSNEAGRGGGIEIFASSPIIKNNRIDNNKAENYLGGGILIWFGSSPDVSGNTITANEGRRRCGCIYIHCDYSPPPLDCKPTVNNNIIENNSADDGGGIYITYYASPTITSNTIANNEARYNGCGISVKPYATPTISNNTISNNNAISYGSGVYVDNFCDVKSIYGASWPRCYFPPNSELNNTYSRNTNQNGLVTERCHVYFLP